MNINIVGLHAVPKNFSLSGLASHELGTHRPGLTLVQFKEDFKMNKNDVAKPAADSTKFNVQAEAQKHKMDRAATKHANKIPGNTEPNAGGANREAGDRKARTNDRATNGGE